MLRFVLLSWKDAILRIFEMKGRTSRAAFLVSIPPVVLIWMGILYFGIVTSQKYKLLDSVPYMIILILPILPGATLVFRRMHDGGNKAFGAGDGLSFLNPFSGLIWLAKLLKQGDSGENKYGPPHIIIPIDNAQALAHNPKQIG